MECLRISENAWGVETGGQRIYSLSNSSTGQLPYCLSLGVLIQRLAQLLGEPSKICLIEFNFSENVAFSLIPLKALMPPQI